MPGVFKKVAFLDEVVEKALFDANTILIANSDDTPSALPVAAQRILGRRAAGGIVAMTYAEVLSELGIAQNADNTGGIVTAAGDMLYATAPGTLARLPKGTDGMILKMVAGVPSWASATTTPAAHASTHKAGGSDVIALNELAVPVAAVDFGRHQAQNFVAHQVADATARDGLTAAVGMMVQQQDDGHLYVCTSLS